MRGGGGTRAKGGPQFVHERAPPGAKILVDDHNGRFRVAVGKHDPKSFSWTKSGLEQAAEATLRQLWKWYAMDSGKPNPFDDEVVA